MNTTTAYNQALETMNTSWEALNALYETNIEEWAKLSQQVSDLVHKSTYRFQTDEVAGERILRIQTPKFHPSSPHWGKHFGDKVHTELNNCEAQMSWDGYWVPERYAVQAKNAIWRILAENNALDLL